MIQEINDDAEDYEQLCAAWEGAQSDARRANRLFESIQALQKNLRDSPEGRATVEALCSHNQRGVRLLAATHTLQWNEQLGVRVLQALERDRGPHTISARQTLQAFRSGDLDLDW